MKATDEQIDEVIQSLVESRKRQRGKRRVTFRDVRAELEHLGLGGGTGRILVRMAALDVSGSRGGARIEAKERLERAEAALEMDRGRSAGRQAIERRSSAVCLSQHVESLQFLALVLARNPGLSLAEAVAAEPPAESLQAAREEVWTHIRAQLRAEAERRAAERRAKRKAKKKAEEPTFRDDPNQLPLLP